MSVLLVQREWTETIAIVIKVPLCGRRPRTHKENGSFRVMRTEVNPSHLRVLCHPFYGTVPHTVSTKG